MHFRKDETVKMTVILFFLIFGVVVITHEFGHFLLAKANGIHVVEFSVGMGPNLISIKKGATRYSLKLFPIGGACMFEGEDGMNMLSEESQGAFNKASVWARISTVAAGPIFNFILAFIISFIAVNMSDILAIRDPVATQIVAGGGAEEAGMQAGDRILSINGEKVRLYQEISLYMQASYRGGDLEIVYERDGERFTTMLTPQYSTSGTAMLGVVNAEYQEPEGFGLLKYAWYEMRLAVKATYKSLSMLIHGQVGREDVAGPVGIAVNVVGKSYEQAKDYGWQSVLISMLNIVLTLSVNLGILNLLPIPALDGGRLVFLIVEVFRGKPLPPEKEGMVHFLGLIFFMVLMVFVFFNDLANIFIH